MLTHSTIQYSAVQYSAVQYSAVRYSAVQCTVTICDHVTVVSFLAVTSPVLDREEMRGPNHQQAPHRTQSKYRQRTLINKMERHEYNKITVLNSIIQCNEI